MLSSYNAATLKGEAIKEFSRMLCKAIENDYLETFLAEHGIVIDKAVEMPITRCHKILVIGALAGSKNDYIRAAWSMGIEEESLEFVCDYSKLTNFNAERLKNSNKYSDIIVGPMPHKMEGINGYSSLIAMMEDNKEIYPKIIYPSNAHKLSLGIDAFKKCLGETRLLELTDVLF